MNYSDRACTIPERVGRGVCIDSLIFSKHACALQAAEEPGVPSLSEAEEAYTAAPGGSADVSHLQAVRQRSRMRLSSIARLEQVRSLRL